MAAFDEAQRVYRDGRLIIEATRDLAVTNDRVRWLREDLEDALLDMKQAILDLDETRADQHLFEAISLMAELVRRVTGEPEAD
jgi:hypothetical protein